MPLDPEWKAKVDRIFSDIALSDEDLEARLGRLENFERLRRRGPEVPKPEATPTYQGVSNILVCRGRVGGLGKLLQQKDVLTDFDFVVYYLDDHRYYIFKSKEEEEAFRKVKNLVFETLQERAGYKAINQFLQEVRDGSVDVGAEYRDAVTNLLSEQDVLKRRFLHAQRRVIELASEKTKGLDTHVLVLTTNPNSVLGLQQDSSINLAGLSNPREGFRYGSSLHTGVRYGQRVVNAFSLNDQFCGEYRGIDVGGCDVLVIGPDAKNVPKLGQSVLVEVGDKGGIRQVFSDKVRIGLPPEQACKILLDLADGSVRAEYTTVDVGPDRVLPYQHISWWKFGIGEDVNIGIRKLQGQTHIFRGPFDNVTREFAAVCGYDYNKFSRGQGRQFHGFLDRSFAKRYSEPTDRREFYGNCNFTQDVEVTVTDS